MVYSTCSMNPVEDEAVVAEVICWFIIYNLSQESKSFGLDNQCLNCFSIVIIVVE